MTDLSFKSFAMAKGFTPPPPVSALTVAKSLGLIPPPPISLRVLMALPGEPGGGESWAMTALQMQYQLMTEWCWIAVATSISHFYNPGSSWTQCSLLTDQLQPPYGSSSFQGQCCPDAQLVASTPGLAAALANPYSPSSLYALQSVNNQLADTPHAGVCNHSGGINGALTQTGNLNGETGSAVSMTDLLTQISAGHPVCVNIQWPAGRGAHSIAASGVEVNSDMVFVLDPVNGPWAGPYQTLATAYQGIGTWVETLYTQP
jgi:hypothetical protein